MIVAIILTAAIAYDRDYILSLGDKLDQTCRRSEVIAVGVLTLIDGHGSPSRIGRAKLAITKLLKGNAGPIIDIEGELPQHLIDGDRSDAAIYFLTRRPVSSEYALIHGVWSPDSVRWVQRHIRRNDLCGPAWGLPAVKVGDSPIRVALAAPLPNGTPSQDNWTEVSAGTQLMIQLQNVGHREWRVIRLLDGSFLGRRHPRYDLEIRRVTGNSPDVLLAACDNLDPITKFDVVRLAPGDCFRVDGPTLPSSLQPGRYTVRLRYTVDRKLVGPFPFRFGDLVAVRSELAHVWEGIAESNLLSIQIK